MDTRARIWGIAALLIGAGCGDVREAADSDGDGLSDADEATLGTDPMATDSDLDGVSDFNDDADGDGVSNADEIAAGTATPPRDSDGPTPPESDAPDEAQGAAGMGDEPNDGDAPGDTGEPGENPGDSGGDTPSDQPGDQPGETPSDEAPAEETCLGLREKCAAGGMEACAQFELECGMDVPPGDAPSCDMLWSQCAMNMRRACEGFITGCEVPGCEDLQAACEGGSEPICGLFERECTENPGEEPTFCASLREACEQGSMDACVLVERDCPARAADCAALEARCKEAGGVGEACDAFAEHCG